VVEENTFTGKRTGILVFGGVDNVVVKENLCRGCLPLSAT